MEQLEQLLTCCVCLDRYRNPKLLPCQHSFCMEPCMEGLVDYVRRQVKCPECRAEHRIPYNGVQAFPTNVTLQRFLELHIDLTGELPDPTANQIMERCQVCSEKAYINPCAHCEKKVCPDCKEAHLDVIKREITRMSSQVRRVLTRLEDALSVTERNLAGLKGNHAHVLDEVDDLVRRFTKAINDKANAIRHELESYVSTELATLNSYKTNLETEINNIQSNCDLVDKHMISESSTITWDDQELMDTKDIFLKTIEFIRNFEYEPGDRRIRFSTTQDPNTIIVGLTNFGDLIFPHSFIVTNTPARQNQFQQQQLAPPSTGIMRSKSDHRLVQQYRDLDDMDDRPAGRDRKFRSRFARRLMGQDDDDGRVRFDNDNTEDRGATSARTRVIDTEDAVKGPMSAIPRMSDCTRVLEKLVDFESPKKKPAPVTGPTVPLEIQQQMQIMQQQQLLQQQRQQQQQQAASNPTPTPQPQQPVRRQVSQDKSTPKPTPAPAPTPAPPARKSQSIDKPRTESESSTSEQSSSSAVDSRTRSTPASAPAAQPSKPKSITPQTSVTSQQGQAKASTPAASSYRRTPQASRSRDEEEEEETESSETESEEESESDEPAAAPARSSATSRDRDVPQPSRSRQRDTRSQVEDSPRAAPAVDQRRFSRDEGNSSGYQYRTRQQSPAERPYGSGGSGSSASSRYGTSTSPYDNANSGLSRSRTGASLYEPPEVPVPTSRLQAKYLNRARLNNMGGSVDIPDDYRSTGKPYYSSRNPYLSKHGEKGDNDRSRDKSKILSRSKSSHELAQAELANSKQSSEEEQQNLSSWARYLKSKYGKTVSTAGNAANNNSNNNTNSQNNQLENETEDGDQLNNSNHTNSVHGKSTSPPPPNKLNNPIASQYSGKKRLLFKFGARGSDPGYFTWPRGIACGPDGSIVVADSSNHRIQVFDAQGSFLKDFGTYGNGDGEFDCLAGVAVNRIGQFIVSDRYNHRIQVFDPSGRFLRSFGSQGSSDGKFNYPWGVTTDALGFIYVCDKENHRIQVFQSDGTFVGKFGVGELEHPHYIAVTCTNKVVVSDTGHHRIYICDVNGKFIGSIGTEGIEHGQFKLPRGVAVDEQGYIFVGDSGNNRIQIFNPDGVHIKSFGGWGSGDGEFKGLEGIAVNSNGNVLVCDRENHRIQVF